MMMTQNQTLPGSRNGQKLLSRVSDPPSFRDRLVTNWMVAGSRVNAISVNLKLTIYPFMLLWLLLLMSTNQARALDGGKPVTEGYLTEEKEPYSTGVTVLPCSKERSLWLLLQNYTLRMEKFLLIVESRRNGDTFC